MSSAVSGITPLIFGAQRFVIGSGLAANVSALQTRVASRMAWATGDIGLSLWSSTSDSSGRLLSADEADLQDVPPPRRTATDRLVSVLVVMASLLGVVLVLHMGCIYRWRYCENRKFYAAKCDPKLFLQRTEMSEGSRLRPRMSMTRSGSSVEGAAVTVLSMHELMAKRKDLVEEMTKLRFKPFPLAYVFPGFPLLAVQIFSTGITSQAIRVLVDRDECNENSCIALGVGAMLMVVAYEAVTISIVLHFHENFAFSWKRAAPPKQVQAVVDPLYRLISRIRVHVVHKDSLHQILDRPRGKFVRPPSLVKEPTRTERLLAAPHIFWHSNASDAVDGIGYALMARSGGDSRPAMLFEMILLGASLILSVFNGLGCLIEPGTWMAVAQMSCVLAVQLSIVCYIVRYMPSADRVMNILIFTQFSLEATGTAMLITRTIFPQLVTANAQMRAFIVSILAMLAPVIQRFYDAFIVNLSKRMRGGFTWKGFFFSLVGFLVFLPTMIIRLTGFDTGSPIAEKAAVMASDDMNKLATKMSNEGLFKQIEEGIAEASARAFWQVHINAEFRRKNKAVLMVASARLVQERWRARARARIVCARWHKAGRLVVTVINLLPDRLRTASERPGLRWLESQVLRLSDAQGSTPEAAPAAERSTINTSTAIHVWMNAGKRWHGLLAGRQTRPTPPGYPPGRQDILDVSAEAFGVDMVDEY